MRCEKLQYEFFYLRNQRLSFDLKVDRTHDPQRARWLRGGEVSADHPVVSVLIPVLDEVDRIGSCLRCRARPRLAEPPARGDRRRQRLGDGTVKRAIQVLSTRPDVASSVVDNTGGGRSSNLNAGLLRAQGGVVCRVDARSIIPAGYIRRCVELLADPARAVVGGSQRMIPGGAGPQALARRPGAREPVRDGHGRYRRGGPSGPSDTVYLGGSGPTSCEKPAGGTTGSGSTRTSISTSGWSASGRSWYAAELEVGYSATTRTAPVARQTGVHCWIFATCGRGNPCPDPSKARCAGRGARGARGPAHLGAAPVRARAAAAAAAHLGAVGLEHHGSAGPAPLQVRARASSPAWRSSGRGPGSLGWSRRRRRIPGMADEVPICVGDRGVPPSRAVDRLLTGVRGGARPRGGRGERPARRRGGGSRRAARSADGRDRRDRGFAHCVTLGLMTATTLSWPSGTTICRPRGPTSSSSRPGSATAAATTACHVSSTATADGADHRADREPPVPAVGAGAAAGPAGLLARTAAGREVAVA